MAKDSNFHFGKVLSSPFEGDEVVITGMSGRFPRSRNVEELYENLSKEMNLLSPIPEEWRVENPNVPPLMGRLDERHRFDPGFFGANHREANALHPSCRMLLESALEALLDAGLNPADVKGANIGVFLATFQNGFELPYKEYENRNFDFNWMIKGSMAERISHYLGLEGPVECLDLACGSSGHVLDDAFRAIRSNRCDGAIVVGANLIFTQNVTSMLADLEILDEDGGNHVFGENSKGYVRSEGIAAIVLQRLKDSKRVYAQVVHSKVNTNGFNEEGMLHPSVESQSQLLQESYAESGVDSREIKFIEAHSTGTKVGDIVELEAIDEALCRNRKSSLIVGSAKSSYGHSELSSGLFSLIKVIVSMEKGWMPPNINCSKIRRDVPALENGRISVLKRALNIEDHTYFGINNLGFAGNNAHLIVKKVKTSGEGRIIRKQQLILVSGRTQKCVENLLNSISSNPHNEDYFDLLRSAFRFEIEGFLHRGFVVISNQTVKSRSLKKIVGRKPHISLRLYGSSKDFFKIQREFSEIPVFSDHLQRLHSLLPNKLANSTLAQTISTQIALIETLKCLNLPIDDVFVPPTSKACANRSIIEVFKILADGGYAFSTIPKHNELENEITLCFENERCQIGSLVGFLTAIGRLYEIGFNPDLQMLHPRTKWPVKAPILSSLIEWNHEDDWYVPPLTFKVETEMSFSLQTSHSNYAYFLDHIIDGRALLSGFGGLNFVWQAFARMTNVETERLQVEFKNVRWHRPLILSAQLNMVLTVKICKLSKRFEVIYDNEMLISGSLGESALLKCALPMKTTEKDIQRNSFYKLLNFHNYLYRGKFVGVEQISTDGTRALIKWRKNWVVFLDHMVTMNIMKANSKIMLVVTSVDSIIVNPQVQMEKIETVYASNNIFRSPAAEVRGLMQSQITKRTNLENPVLRSYKFVPYKGTIEEEEAIWVLVMIVLDNIEKNHVQVAEVLDEFNEECSLANAVSEVFAELSISSKVSKVVEILTELDSDLVITTKRDTLENVVPNLKEGAFLLLRQSSNHCLNIISDTVVVSVYDTQRETFILFRKPFTIHHFDVVHFSNGFSSLSKLENSLEAGKKTLLVSENDPKSGVTELMSFLRSKYRNLISCMLVIGDAPKFSTKNAFYKKQLKMGLAMNILLNGTWGIDLHFPLNIQTAKCKHAIGTVEKGNINNVRWIEGPLGITAADHLVNVDYVGLNFHDALIASGKINSTAYAEGIEPNTLRLGMEFSGRNLRDEMVMGLVRDGALSNMVESNEFFTWRVPQAWSLEDAATVPCAYTIALYVLKILARVKCGQTVLVHAGSGGIGQACLNIANFYGCTTFTTVGTREKKRLLMKHNLALQDTHIGNTCDTSFEHLIMKQTGGKGVDIIINCLPEEKLRAGLRCLCRRGKFFDVGNIDALKNVAFDIINVRKGRTLYGVNLQSILFGNINLKRKLFKLMYDGIQSGYVKPLLRLTCSVNQVQDALQFMVTSRHLGKIVVRVKDKGMETPGTFDAIPKFYAHSAKVYVLTGELEGFGVELADWLITRGVRHIVIASEDSITDYQHYKITTWKKFGAKIVITGHSALTINGCKSLISECNSLGEIHAVFNVMLGENFSTQYLQNLDLVTRDLCPNLQYFVNCSSTSIEKGMVHSIQNGVIRRICNNRKAEGFPALAIEWGPIADLIFPEEADEASKMIKQKLSSCLQVLDIFLTQNHTVVSSFIPVKVSNNESKTDHFFNELSRMIGINIAQVSLQSTLSQLGMDSISSVEIKQFLEDKFKIVKSFNELKNLTLSKLKEEVEK